MVEKAFLERVASDTACPRYILEELYYVGDYDILLLLAKNPSTPAHILDLLAKIEPSYERNIKTVVAINSSTARGTLALLAEDENPTVRSAVASNKTVSIEILENLAYDESPVVRLQVAENPRTPYKLKYMLWQDKEILRLLSLF